VRDQRAKAPQPSGAGRHRAICVVLRSVESRCGYTPSLVPRIWSGGAPAKIGSHSCTDPKQDFRTAIEKDLGHAMMWRAIVSFASPSVSRSDILGRLEAILKDYPHSEHHERALRTAKVLRRMIAEDDSHARSAPKDLAQITSDEQARELIYQLREQHGEQISQPGSCDIFFNWENVTNTPAHQLVRLGNAAVPQLIAALDSDTLTRSVGFWRDFSFSHTVLTVGDCGERLRQRITGKSFLPPDSHSKYLSETGLSGVARRAAESWWAECQSKGEERTLIDAVAGGDRDSPAQAELLSKKYLPAATAALIRGAQAATSALVRASLVQHAGALLQGSGTQRRGFGADRE